MSPAPAPHKDAFKSFMAALLRGPKRTVWINRKVHADYLVRGVFPEITASDPFSASAAAGAWFGVPGSVARAMLSDAIAQVEHERATGNRRATKWSWLRNQLRRTLDCWETHTVGQVEGAGR